MEIDIVNNKTISVTFMTLKQKMHKNQKSIATTNKPCKNYHGNIVKNGIKETNNYINDIKSTQITYIGDEGGS